MLEEQKFAEDHWPWHICASNFSGHNENPSTFRWNGKLVILNRNYESQIDTDIHQQKDTTRFFRVLQESSLSSLREFARKMNDEALKILFGSDWSKIRNFARQQELRHLILDKLRSYGGKYIPLSRRRMRQIIGGRFSGEEFDTVLTTLLEGQTITKVQGKFLLAT
jgi:hypothetical protein